MTTVYWFHTKLSPCILQQNCAHADTHSRNSAALIPVKSFQRLVYQHLKFRSYERSALHVRTIRKMDGNIFQERWKVSVGKVPAGSWQKWSSKLVARWIFTEQIKAISGNEQLNIRAGRQAWHHVASGKGEWMKKRLVWICEASNGTEHRTRVARASVWTTSMQICGCRVRSIVFLGCFAGNNLWCLWLRIQLRFKDIVLSSARLMTGVDDDAQDQVGDEAVYV